MEKLTFSYALSRYRFGRLKSCDPSRFLQDVDQRYIAASGQAAMSRNREFFSPIARPGKGELATPRQKRMPLPSAATRADFEASDTSGLTAGMKVEHPKFGYGTVVLIETEGFERKAKVSFDNFGVRTLLLSFARLRICN
jgi:DNA helicase-2/ATP-dependent DNA helicase PcrA